ncbi:hypothetical protein JX266_009991 [Neoarthrinium moseri]|nr:hypothetical protein JX266_009991 [Neoarthrinium moseri]
MESIDPLIQIGSALLGTRQWSFASLLITALQFLGFVGSLTLSVRRLSVRVVISIQEKDVEFTTEDIKNFIKALHELGDDEWNVIEFKNSGALQGLSKSSVNAVLQHRTLLCDDPFREAALRHLSRSLAGPFEIRSQKVDIVPEWRMNRMSDNDRIFGGCLVLMKLDMANTRLSCDTADTGGSILDWAKSVLWLSERYLADFDYDVLFLPDEVVHTLCEAISNPSTTKLASVLKVAQRLITAVSKKCEEDMKARLIFLNGIVVLMQKCRKQVKS